MLSKMGKPLGCKGLVLTAVAAMALVPAFSMAKGSGKSSHGHHHHHHHSKSATGNTAKPLTVKPGSSKHHGHHKGATPSHLIKKQTVQNSIKKPIVASTLASVRH